MKKVIITLCALISVNMHGMMKEPVTFTTYMSDLKAGENYSINAKQALGVYAPLRSDDMYKTYHKLKNANGQILSKGICTANICKFKAPSKGSYILTVAHNKRLDPKVSNFLSQKYRKLIKSRPVLFRKIILTVK